MKSYLERMYAYDQEASTTLMGLLAGLSNDELEADRKSHYKSLKGLVLHTIQGHMFFNNMFKGALGESAAMLKNYENTQEMTYEACLPLVEEMHSNMQAMVAGLTEEQFEVNMEFFGKTKTVASMLLLLFNHTVHHRGQISQILDEMGIQHDWTILCKG